MRYIDVEWLHSSPGDPIRLLCEVGADHYETRKIEFWSDGRVGYASKVGTSRDTVLGEKPVPSLEEINSQGPFRGVEIDAAAFEKLWDEHVLAPQLRNARR